MWVCKNDPLLLTKKYRTWQKTKIRRPAETWTARDLYIPNKWPDIATHLYACIKQNMRQSEHRIVNSYVRLYLISNGILHVTRYGQQIWYGRHIFIFHLLLELVAMLGFFFLLLLKKIMHFPVEFALPGKSRFSGQQSVLNFSDQKLRQIDNPMQYKIQSDVLIHSIFFSIWG